MRRAKMFFNPSLAETPPDSTFRRSIPSTRVFFFQELVSLDATHRNFPLGLERWVSLRTFTEYRKRKLISASNLPATGRTMSPNSNGLSNPGAVVESPQSPGSESTDTAMMDTKGRIFVAKIPRTVTEDEFKEYFEMFGEVKDAYMPKDRTQRYYRGIGFVTYAEEESANRVMEVKHSFHDHEVVVDYAIPPKKQQKERKEQEATTKAEKVASDKVEEDPIVPQPPPKSEETVKFNSQLPILHEMTLAGTSLMESISGTQDRCPSTRPACLSGFNLPGLSQPEFGSCGSSYTGSPFVETPQPYLGYPPPQVSTMLDPPPPLQYHQQQQPECADFPALGTFHELEALMRTSSSLDFSLNGSMKHSHSFASTTDLSMVFDSSSDLMSTGAYSQESDVTFRSQQEAFPTTRSLSQEDILHALRETSYVKPPAVQLKDLVALATMQRMAAASNCGLSGGNSLQALGLDMMSQSPAGLGFNAGGINMGGMNAVPPSIGYADASNAFLADSLAPLQCASPSPLQRKWHREAPRVFVGRLPKELTKSDLNEHYSKFGPVMDVYMPRAKNCSAKHRGFGFVSFQTADSIERVIAHGAHVIKGHHVAVDRALPIDMAFFD
ncbi:hypothetical protein BSKO_12878 [Bryopsis sp. KO-2023]|nr:hypothetical protein BSKO_12878 [Bryopsis sp. KO-2023]